FHSSIPVIFSSYFARHPRDLHSFPTRRSSDLLTFLTVIALFLFGGAVLHGFSFALVVGIIIGTYSSVFIASPIVLFWHDWFDDQDRKSTRLNSSHEWISYAVFCLKKKKNI